MTPRHRPLPFLPKFLGFVMMLFIGILIVTYWIARKANPVMLDERGKIVVSGSH